MDVPLPRCQALARAPTVAFRRRSGTASRRLPPTPTCAPMGRGRLFAKTCFPLHTVETRCRRWRPPRGHRPRYSAAISSGHASVMQSRWLRANGASVPHLAATCESGPAIELALGAPDRGSGPSGLEGVRAEHARASSLGRGERIFAAAGRHAHVKTGCARARAAAQPALERRLSTRSGSRARVSHKRAVRRNAGGRRPRAPAPSGPRIDLKIRDSQFCYVERGGGRVTRPHPTLSTLLAALRVETRSSGRRGASRRWVGPPRGPAPPTLCASARSHRDGPAARLMRDRPPVFASTLDTVLLLNTTEQLLDRRGAGLGARPRRNQFLRESCRAPRMRSCLPLLAAGRWCRGGAPIA